MPASVANSIIKSISRKLVYSKGSDRQCSVDSNLLALLLKNIAANSGTDKSHFRPDFISIVKWCNELIYQPYEMSDLSFKYVVHFVLNQKLFSERRMQDPCRIILGQRNIRELKNVYYAMHGFCVMMALSQLRHLPDYVFSCNHI